MLEIQQQMNGHCTLPRDWQQQQQQLFQQQHQCEDLYIGGNNEVSITMIKDKIMDS